MALRALRGRRFDLRGLGRDLPLKAIAIAVSLVLYVTVAQAVVREQTVTFDGRIPVERPEIAEGLVLRGQLGEVTVRLRGAPGPLSGVTREDLRASIELGPALSPRAEAQDARVVVTVRREGVKVVDASPASVPVRLERLTQRTLAVQTRFANEPPRGFAPATPVVTPAEVMVSGPESAVAAVAAVFATVRFGDVALDITQGAQAQAVDQAGQPIEGLQVEPSGVQVRVPVLPTSTTRTVPVRWDLRGTVAPGHWISAMTADPAAVTIRGTPEAVGTIERIDTVPIDVDGLDASRTITAALVLPTGITLLQPTPVTVTLTVTPLTGSRPFALAVQVVDLGADLIAEVQPAIVEVIVSGPLPALSALTVEQVAASVNAAGRGAGTHQLDVAVRVPSGLRAASVRPVRVSVTVRAR